jgi:23S rRNA (cytidine1920-2'-O)/16S rRNA (cytidine1409-2'-O)-methyltransferase
MTKERLDQALVNRGLVGSREKGKALIMAGKVYVNEVRVEKPGTQVKQEDALKIKGEEIPYVSRGGLKLKKAVDSFGLDLGGKVILDIGASTGGFTHCALLEGAKKAYAVDVGYGQLDWSLRQDPRVVCLERTNARYLSEKEIPELVDIITIDVAFISLEKILPAAANLLKEGGVIMALVKPQFEAGREKVGKKGVVREPAIHREVLERVLSYCHAFGLEASGLDYSPVTGPEGNMEFLLLLKKKGKMVSVDWQQVIAETVEKAHRELR